MRALRGARTATTRATRALTPAATTTPPATKKRRKILFQLCPLWQTRGWVASGPSTTRTTSAPLRPPPAPPLALACRLDLLHSKFLVFILENQLYRSLSGCKNCPDPLLSLASPVRFSLSFFDEATWRTDLSDICDETSLLGQRFGVVHALVNILFSHILQTHHQSHQSRSITLMCKT